MVGGEGFVTGLCKRRIWRVKEVAVIHE